MAVTLKTIAQEVGTSVATVSMALSDDSRIKNDTKERIRRASIRLGYCTPENLRARRQEALTRKTLRYLFVSLGRDAQQPYDGFAAHLTHSPAMRGIVLSLYRPRNETPEGLLLELANQADDFQGILLYGRVTREVLVALSTLPIPIVFCGPIVGAWPSSDEPMRAVGVGLDEMLAGRMATELLIQAGHRRIAMITARGVAGLYYDRWLTGYRLALLEAGLPVDAELINLTSERTMKQGTPPPCLLLSNPPTAFVFPDPTHATLVRRTSQYDEAILSPSNAVLGGSRRSLEVTSLQDYPSLQVDLELLMETCFQQLLTLQQVAEPQAFRMVVLPVRQVNLDRLIPILGS